MRTCSANRFSFRSARSLDSAHPSSHFLPQVCLELWRKRSARSARRSASLSRILSNGRRASNCIRCTGRSTSHWATHSLQPYTSAPYSRSCGVSQQSYVQRVLRHDTLPCTSLSWIALRAPFFIALATTLMLACVSALHVEPDTVQQREAYLFSYFTRNGEDGVHLAYSRDGIHWLPLNDGKAVITPAITGSGAGWQEWNTTAALMRDPSILRGPDGMFHLVWTIAWTDHGIGVAHSRDLIHWSKQTRVPVMEHEPTALNTWAPDLFYDLSLIHISEPTR